MDQKIDMKQDRENQKFWDNWLSKEQTLVIGNKPVNAEDVKEQVAEKLGLHKRSITPTTLDQVIFDKSTDDIFYKEIYQYKGNIVTRFTMRDLNIKGFKFSENKDFQSFLGNKEKLSMSGKTDKFKLGVSKIELNPLEKDLLNISINDLLNNIDKKAVLTDIFARTNGEIKLDKEGNIETHTVVLYKRPVFEGKHEIVVIDPSNFRFSSHLANIQNFNHIKHEKLGFITSSYDNKQIYKPEIIKGLKEGIGSLSIQYRDCIDIAVKINFGCNSQEDVDIANVLNMNIVQEITNNPEVNNNIIDLDAPVRIKQATQSFIRKNFELLVDRTQKLFKHCLAINNEQKSEVYRKYEEQYKVLLSNPYEPINYIACVEELKSVHDKFYEDIRVLMGEQHNDLNLSMEL